MMLSKDLSVKRKKLGKLKSGTPASHMIFSASLRSSAQHFLPLRSKEERDKYKAIWLNSDFSE